MGFNRQGLGVHPRRVPTLPSPNARSFAIHRGSAGHCWTTLVADDSDGMHPRFAKLQVDSGGTDYSVNLYDINYRTWDVRCIWQGSRLEAFGLIGDSIFCKKADGWMVLDAASGKLSQEIPFVPLARDGDFLLVRKPGETEGCWSYWLAQRKYIAHFGAVDSPRRGFSQSKLSPDGKSKAWVLASMPLNLDWHGGKIQEAGSFCKEMVRRMTFRSPPNSWLSPAAEYRSFRKAFNSRSPLRERSNFAPAR